MTRILITSSVLIAALFLLRCVFRSRIDPRVQYALWGLVLIRLLVPANLTVWNFSLPDAAETVERTVEQAAAVPLYVGRAESVPLDSLSGGKKGIRPGEEVWRGVTAALQWQTRTMPPRRFTAVASGGTACGKSGWQPRRFFFSPAIFIFGKSSAGIEHY